MREARGLLKAAAARYVPRTQDVRAVFLNTPTLRRRTSADRQRDGDGRCEAGLSRAGLGGVGIAPAIARCRTSARRSRSASSRAASVRANGGSGIGSDMARQRRLFLVGSAEGSCSQSAESIKDAGVIMNWMRAGATDAVRLHTRPSPRTAACSQLLQLSSAHPKTRLTMFSFCSISTILQPLGEAPACR